MEWVTAALAAFVVIVPVALLPEQPVRIAAALLFLVGAVLLLRGARDADRAEAEQEQEFAQEAGVTGGAAGGLTAESGWRAFGASFLVLFLAEWGDLSQLLTAGLVASGRPVVPVFVGSWLGLSFVAGVGALLGRVLLRYISLRIVRFVWAAVCLVLAAVITLQVITRL